MMTTSAKILAILALSLLGVSCANQIPRKITIRNQSGRRVEVNWINPDNGQAALMSDPDVLTGTDFVLDSFVSHKFQVKEIPSKNTGECETQGECKVDHFIVNDNEQQSMTVDANFKIIHDDHKTVARMEANSLVADCKALAKQSLQDVDANVEEVLSALSSCLKKDLAQQLKYVAEDIAFSAQTRTKMAEFFENYTCADYGLPTTEPKKSETWFDVMRQKDLKVGVMHERPSSRIHVVEDFITEEECQAMEDSAAPLLHRAVVADGKGGNEYSENRKAMQAGITVPWNLEGEGNPIATISRRVYDYTNWVLSMKIDEHGQEDLMSIQYTGRGFNETKPDQYMPHCDGECTGLEHKYGNRMATMVMYCTVPTKGGATNFRNSGIHVQANKGSAVFFSYMDPKTKIMDSGFTEHSGCPVVEGEKKIVTQWIRFGVTKEVPWTAYNSLGLLKTDEEE